MKPRWIVVFALLGVMCSGAVACAWLFVSLPEYEAQLRRIWSLPPAESRRAPLGLIAVAIALASPIAMRVVWTRGAGESESRSRVGTAAAAVMVMWWVAVASYAVVSAPWAG